MPATVFDIRDDTAMYSRNCPLGVLDVDKKEFEDNKPPSIHEMEPEEQLKWAYKVLKANEKETDIKIFHGDVVWIGEHQDRNMGIHFWDAKNETIVPMATHRGDYGHVPEMFAVGKGEGEFSPGHWDGISYYNNLEPLWSSEKKDWIYPSQDE